MKNSKFRYSQLRDSYDEGQTKAYLERNVYRHDQNITWAFKLLMIVFPWLLASLFGVVSLILWTRLPIPSSLGSYELGFTTDLRDFGHGAQIPFEKVLFTGNLFFPSNETFEGPLRQSKDELNKTEYFGDYSGIPRQEIDDNWDRLIKDRYISISEEEARASWGDRFSEFADKESGGYSAGLDVFHNLHCLNYLRKGFFPDYYPRDKTYEIHRDHCIDILRQGIQCYGSTTLIPTMFMDGLSRNTINSDQVHTCRSFDFLRDWTTQRGVGGRLYVDRETASIDKNRK